MPVVLRRSLLACLLLWIAIGVAQAQDSTPAPPATAPATYDPNLFQRRIPPDQLKFLAQFDGAPSGDLWKDKAFHKLLKDVIPNCTFHYGVDKSFDSAMDEVIAGSRVPVVVRAGRFVTLGGAMGKYLSGRGFLWFDMQEGIAIGGFFFHPTNGEPTPALNIFSRQVLNETVLSGTQMPPEFTADFIQWATEARVPPVLARYFITGSNKKILLEHDEDFCRSWDGTVLPPDSGCRQMAADAADLDLSAAYYLDATHHATNATAWMMSEDQTAFLQVRNRQCGGVLDPLGCRIRVTQERIHTIVRRGPPSAPKPRPH
jgi:hypothetical protein